MQGLLERIGEKEFLGEYILSKGVRHQAVKKLIL